MLKIVLVEEDGIGGGLEGRDECKLMVVEGHDKGVEGRKGSELVVAFLVEVFFDRAFLVHREELVLVRVRLPLQRLHFVLAVGFGNGM